VSYHTPKRENCHFSVEVSSMARVSGLFVLSFVLMIVGLIMAVQLRGIWEFVGIVLMVVPLFIGACVDLSEQR
jgi:uncharacterized membrane protein YedE/YeeE